MRSLLPLINSYTHAHPAKTIKTVAAHVMPIKVVPRYAYTPMSLPWWLIALETLLMIAVAMAEAMSSERNASCALSQYQRDHDSLGAM